MDPVAIIGVGCRFPGAAGPEPFWRALREGKDAVSEVPADRWDVDAFHDPDPARPGTMTTRWGGFLDNVDGFDASFFGISPRESVYMDPQQRLLLEACWEAFEDAGLVPERLAGDPVGVFVGISSYDYGALQLSRPDLISDGYVNTGGALSIAANRISYLFDFRGPSLAIDTACSSSLTAVYLACRSLCDGKSRLAVAGGVNLILTPAVTIGFDKLRAMSPDGRCKAFDAAANGYVRGEGAGMLVLKPLALAVEDGDPIYAVIRGGAMNQDGRTNGLTAPNGLSQEALIREALRDAEVAPASIGYVEAHGTGTPLGDPIELDALGKVLAIGRSTGPPCAVGSVKTNIGHLEAAAGVAGLIKLALALRHREIPPSLHFRNPNPHIPFDRLPLYVPRELTPWPEGLEPAIGGVSAFGFGGTNVHLILEEPPAERIDGARVPAAGAARAHLLPLSGQTPEALRALAREYRALLEAPGPEDAAADDRFIEDLSCAMAQRRTHHDHRLALVAHSLEAGREQLDAFLDGDILRRMAVGVRSPGARRKLVFVFPGQGGQWPGMGQELLREEPAFREVMERFDQAMRPHANWSLMEELVADGSQSRLDQVDVVQPVLCAIQIGLAVLLRSWGVEPHAVIGQSLGEIAAAQVAGALALEDAARIICCRSRIVKKASGRGAMAVVDLPLAEARAAVAGREDRVSVAVSSSPSSTVLAGDRDALEEILGELERREVFCRWINVDYASHSPQMEPLRGELLGALDGLRPQNPALPFYSTVAGGPAPSVPLDATYWVRNLREPVLFSDALQRLLTDKHDIFLEISPHPVAAQAIHQTLGHLKATGDVLFSLRREEPERPALLDAVGGLYVLGHPVDWSRLQSRRGRNVRLPSYPWQRERLWRDELSETEPPARSADAERGSGSSHPLLGRHVTSAAHPGTHFWNVDLGTPRHEYLREHRVDGCSVLPASFYVEMALAAAAELHSAGAVLLELDLQRPLVLEGENLPVLQLVLEPGGPERVTARFFRTAPGPDRPTLHATGILGLRTSEFPPPPREVPEEMEMRCPEVQPGAEHYASLVRRGLEYGPAFRSVTEIRRGDGEALARLELPETIEQEAHRYAVHPAVLDAAFQVLAAALPRQGEGDDDLFVPTAVRGVVLAGPAPPGRLWCRARVRQGVAEDGTVEGEIQVMAKDGQQLAAVETLRLQRVTEARATQRHRLSNMLYEVAWRPVPVSPEEGPRQPGTWLLLGGRDRATRVLRERLEASGERCVVVTPGKTFARSASDRFRVDPGDAAGFGRLLQEAVPGTSPPCRGIVHLWSQAAATNEGDGALDLEAAGRLGPESLLHLVQAVVQSEHVVEPRLHVVTRGAQFVVPEDGPPAVAQAPLWGLVRTVTHEHPELRAMAVDLGSPGAAEEADALFRELWSNGSDDQIALRGGQRLVARLVRREEGPATEPGDQSGPAAAGEFQVEIPRTGVLDHLTVRANSRRDPGPGEVRIQVAWAGLNFRDVLLALGILPSEGDGPVRLGFECAGTVEAVAADITHLKVGDEVIAIAPHCLASSVTTPAAWTVPKPAGLDMQQAATIPVAFLTAWYALCHLGRLQPGERLLVHTASGGVGLAALQVAGRIGAEVFATAGTPEKREFLRAQGVRHVADSRSLDFREQVLEWTGGEGVDAVLNTLAGDAIGAGLALLRSSGRFLELGKRDILQNAPLGLQFLENNVTFSAIDIHRLARLQPAQFGDLLHQAMRYFVDEGLEPLPSQPFPADEAEDAFRTLSRAMHKGKVVVSMQGRRRLTGSPGWPGPRPDGTYLITGGMGGLGLVVAGWLVDCGARHLVLAGRGPASEATRNAVRPLQEAGARISLVQADVTLEADVGRVLAEIQSEMPPLRGVLHCAGLLDDGVLLHLDRQRLEKVMAPKVTGAWNLHRATEGLGLDLFVLFSSAASLLGPPGQGNYAAANAFLDGLAHFRRHRGLPALSVNWGPWAEVGLAASAKRGGRLEVHGMESLAARDGTGALDRLLREGATQVAVLSLAPAGWKSLARSLGSPPLLEELADEEDAASPGDGAPRGGVASMVLAAEEGERQALLEAYLRAEIAPVLRIQSSRIELDRPLNRMGLDSLMAVELKNRIELELGVTLPLLQLLQGPTVSQVAVLLMHRLALQVPPTGDHTETTDDGAERSSSSILRSILPDGEGKERG